MYNIGGSHLLEELVMADLQSVMNAVDELSQDDLETLYRHIVERRLASWWIVPSENIAKIEEVLQPVHEEAAEMTEEEINATIDQAIAEVRRERKTNSRL
jgi:hypothetical protein